MKNSLQKYKTKNVTIVKGNIKNIFPEVLKIITSVERYSKTQKFRRNFYKLIPLFVILLLFLLYFTFILKYPNYRILIITIPVVYYYIRNLKYVKCRYRYIFPELKYEMLLKTLKEICNNSPDIKVKVKIYKSFYEKRIKYIIFSKSVEHRILLIFKYIKLKEPFTYQFKVKKWKIYTEDYEIIAYYKVKLSFNNQKLKTNIVKYINKNGIKEKIEEFNYVSKNYPEYSLL